MSAELLLIVVVIVIFICAPVSVPQRRDESCYHGAFDWRNCGECSKVKRRIIRHEDAALNTTI